MAQPPHNLGLSISRWIAPACFFSAFVLVSTSRLITIAVVTLDEVRDIDGNIIYDAEGNIVTIVDHWKTWLLNWKAHALLGLGIVFFIMPFLPYFQRLWLLALRRKRAAKE